ncbi:Chloride channel protein EriC [hydrothermal vent metagenome]|uniref:Chloride channel protein EriC n=1 Tax=hydrothermal vent metagenome TaxID=652676 RepID=A0A3B0YJ59_9ZZZZ
MPKKNIISDWFHRHLENLRLRLSHAEALPQLVFIGILSGLVTGTVIIAFRALIETAQASFLPNLDTESYEQLSLLWRFSLPVLAAIFIALLFRLAGKSQNLQTGIVHVMERLAYHQGHLPFKNMILQFLGASVAIIGGFSVGREGPSVHLGAASSSLLGRYMQLPNNSIRILVACGSAAAIGASFNTPLAGVIFAMEVVMMEYTIAGFTPVILASVTGTAIARAFYSDNITFTVPNMRLEGLIEIPYIIACGLVIGGLAALFIKSLELVSSLSVKRSLTLRVLLAGVLMGGLAMYIPEIMGIGYDTVINALTGNLASIGVVALILLLLAKLFATTIVLGLGIPAGLIGPTLFCGAIAGLLMGLLAQVLFIHPSAAGYYALLGMGAMMGAVLQAPLAALTAIVELTFSRDIILPGMVIIISALLTSRVLFDKGSIFITLMQARGLDYRNDPISQSLLRMGVASAMDRDIVSLDKNATLEQILLSLESSPNWIVITENNTPIALMPAPDLARQYLEINPDSSTLEKEEDKDIRAKVDIDLIEIPAKRLQLEAISLQSNLLQAVQLLDKSGAEALYIRGSGEYSPTYGILTRELIGGSYHKG